MRYDLDLNKQYQQNKASRDLISAGPASEKWQGLYANLPQMAAQTIYPTKYKLSLSCIMAANTCSQPPEFETVRGQLTITRSILNTNRRMYWYMSVQKLRI